MRLESVRFSCGQSYMTSRSYLFSTLVGLAIFSRTTSTSTWYDARRRGALGAGCRRDGRLLRDRQFLFLMHSAALHVLALFTVHLYRILISFAKLNEKWVTKRPEAPW